MRCGRKICCLGEMCTHTETDRCIRDVAIGCTTEIPMDQPGVGVMAN